MTDIKRKLTIRKDDPFLTLFLQKNQGSASKKNVDLTSNKGGLGEIDEMNLDLESYDSNQEGNSESDGEDEEDEDQEEKSQASNDEYGFLPDLGDKEQAYGGIPEIEDYKNEIYWKLPENVRHAIDLAKLKS